MSSYETMLERIPPQSIDAEQAALGGMLLGGRMIPIAREIVTPEDFYRESHRIIYRGILELAAANIPVDLITLSEWLKTREQLEAIGGMLYITTVMSQVPTEAGVPHYCGIVKHKAIARQLIRDADEIMFTAYQPDADLPALLDQAAKRTAAIADRLTDGKVSGIKSLYDVVISARNARKAQDAVGLEVGYRPTFKSLSRKLTSWTPGTFVVIGGEESRGKSIFALQSGLQMSENGAMGLLFSLEMPGDMIARRMVQAYTGRNMAQAERVSYRLENSEDVYADWNYAAEQLMRMPIVTLDAPTLTPADVRAVGREAKRKFGALDYIIVDYLQLMDADDSTITDELKRITAVSRALKAVARELQCVVIAVCALNMSDGGRPNSKRVRYGPQVKYDADVMIFLHRVKPDDQSEIEIIIDKQRMGGRTREGEILLHFDETRLKFSEQGEPEPTFEPRQYKETA